MSTTENQIQEPTPRCGAMNPTVYPIDDKVHEHTMSIKEHVENHFNRQFNVFVPQFYTIQQVNGINYFVKVMVDNGSYLHIRFHWARDGTITFSSAQDGKEQDTSMEYF